MFSRFCSSAVIALALLCASFCGILQAQDDTLATIRKEHSQIFWIWQVMSKVQPGRVEDDMNRTYSQKLNSSFSLASGSSTISPINVMLNYNRIIFFGGYNSNLRFLQGLGFFSTTPYLGSSDFAVTRVFHEITLGIGYAFINTPRFRLYPAFAATTALDLLTFSPNRDSLQSIFAKPLTSHSVTQELQGTILEFSIGADYRIPLLAFDFYVMTKIGFNYEPADNRWFSRRGIFFQIGVGVGTERW